MGRIIEGPSVTSLLFCRRLGLGLRLLFLESSMDTTAATAAMAAAGGEEEDQTRMEAVTDKLQTRDAIRLYNWVSHRCFSDCVTTFYRRALGKKEEDCVRSCVRKFLLLSSASAARFAHLADPSSAAFDD